MEKQQEWRKRTTLKIWSKVQEINKMHLKFKKIPFKRHISTAEPRVRLWLLFWEYAGRMGHFVSWMVQSYISFIYDYSWLPKYRYIIKINHESLQILQNLEKGDLEKTQITFGDHWEWSFRKWYTSPLGICEQVKRVKNYVIELHNITY